MHFKKKTLGNIPSLLMLITILLYSCEKENQVKPVISGNTVSVEEINKLKSFLFDATGTPLNKIEFASDKMVFTIDKDVVMSLEGARAHYAKSQTFIATPKEGRTEQRRFTFLMNSTAARTNTIYIDPAVPSDWVTAIGQAINNWNGTDTQIKASLTTTAANAKIVVTMSDVLPGQIIAQASVPDTTGNSGSAVIINPTYNAIPASLQQFAMTHALGHCFGFMHTNQIFGDVIADTPVTDANSVMNSFVLDWKGFTFYDLISYGVVYPNVIGTRRFLGYYNTANSTRLYTVKTGELGAAGSGGWVFERSVGYIYTSQPNAWTTALYRYHNTSNGDYLYTTNFGELGNGGNVGWIYEGIAGYVSLTQTPGTKPLYRYHNRFSGLHYYTSNSSELDSSWIYESIQGYLW